MLLNNFTITANGDTIELLSPISVGANTQAADNLGDSNFQNNADIDASTSASTSVPLSSASASASAIPNTSLSGSAASGVNIPGGIFAAVLAGMTDGNAQISGFFQIDDPSDPSVEATFDANITYAQSLMTDVLGISADSEVTFAFSMSPDDSDFDTNFLFLDNPLSIGSNQTLSQNPTEDLTGSTLVQTNTPLFFTLSLDAESDGANSPEPASLLLAAAGAGALLSRRLIFRRLRLAPRR